MGGWEYGRLRGVLQEQLRLHAALVCHALFLPDVTGQPLIIIKVSRVDPVAVSADGEKKGGCRSCWTDL